MKLVNPLSFLWHVNDHTPVSVSIDITNICNLRCKHCYYYMKEYQQNALQDEGWIEQLKTLRKQNPTIIHATWVGGEPMLKRELIEKGVEVFPFNWVVTNGTVGLPKLKNTAYFISIDGVKEIHEKIRGKNTYDKIIRNVQNSNSRIFIHTVITKLNEYCLEQLANEWAGKVRGIKFSFYTPMQYIDDPLFVKPEERDTIIKRIEELKKTYGDFILMSRKELELMTSSNYTKVIDPSTREVKNCLLKKGMVISLDSYGRVKHPCVMGEMDCSRCGCVIPYMLHAAFVSKDLETIKMIAWTFFR